MTVLAQILVNNLVGIKGAISDIVDNTQKWTHNETLAAWIIKYPTRSLVEYHRNFTLIKITDKTVEELLYLTTPVVVDENPVGVSWHFIEPEKISPEWNELFTTGETTKTFAEVEPYLRELI